MILSKVYNHVFSHKTSHLKIIFIVGTGRSGTHWIGYIMRDHPEINATIEKAKIFSISTSMALNGDYSKYNKLVRAYKKELKLSWPKHYLDKCHPNIWHAERLINDFKNAYFIGIVRNPYATVSSMLKHRGVLEWSRRWREFPVPNRFLGITEETSENYDQMSLEEKCTLRWISHYKRMKEVEKKIGNRLFVIKYEDMFIKTESVMKELQFFLKLRNPIHVKHIKNESLNKWKKILSSNQIKKIDVMLEKNQMKLTTS